MKVADDDKSVCDAVRVPGHVVPVEIENQFAKRIARLGDRRVAQRADLVNFKLSLHLLFDCDLCFCLCIYLSLLYLYAHANFHFISIRIMFAFLLAPMILRILLCIRIRLRPLVCLGRLAAQYVDL